MIRDFKLLDANDAYLLTGNFISSKSCKMDQLHEICTYMKCFYSDDDPIMYEPPHPFAFAAKTRNDDTPNFREAMDSPDREGFLLAMQDEYNSLLNLDAWNVVPRSKAIKAKKRIFDSTWAFRRKRYPDGKVKRLKARFCFRGDQQVQGVDFHDAYSPVVQWSTVRLLLILSVILGWKSCQVDYQLAFVQAKIKPGSLYCEMPRGFEQKGMILELKRNLYGQRDAPKNWFAHLRSNLIHRGYQPCVNEQCLFISDKVICLVYVDDCIFFAKEQKDIDHALASLKSTHPKYKHLSTHSSISSSDHNKFKLSAFGLDIEEDYAGFLGINIHHHDDGSIELLQTGLIDRIIAGLNLDDPETKVKSTPARVEPLLKDENGPPRKEHWNYASIIGMLLYLTSNSRPDLAFAVNQCARYTHCAKLSHEVAIKRIGRYLAGTKTRGLLINPNTTNLSLDMYADADFAGLWNFEHADDPSSVKSRTGFIITLGDIPITWGSKLQTEIATSTMHAEYIALSTSLRELIPIKSLLEEVSTLFHIQRDDTTRVIRVFEDNEGTLKLAKLEYPRTTPQSKHYGIKYHWFREKSSELNLQLQHIDTSKQKADIFTKGLPPNEHLPKRKLINGW